MEFKLRGEFVELDNLLKALELVTGGPDAKLQIRSGAVTVNGLVESRVRRKLRRGDRVEFSGNAIIVS